MALKIRSKDTVIVISGKDKGKIGIVEYICLKRNKILIKGVNIIKKHQKGIPAQNIHSAILKKEALIHISNVAIINSSTKKADRIGFRFENGKKFRFFKSNNQFLK